MKISGTILDRGIYIVFLGIMGLYYIYSFFFPIETDFWLVRNGFPILLVEFFTIFILGMVAVLHEQHQGIPQQRRQHPIAGLAATLLLMGAFIMLFNPWLFIYALISIAIKSIRFRSETERITTMNYQVISTVCLIVAAVAALIASNLFLFFQRQIILYREFFETFPGTISGMIVENPGFIAVWGFFFFFLLILYEFFKKHIIIHSAHAPPQI